jgi:agmatinase
MKVVFRMVGTAAALAAVLEASYQVEFYDDVLDAEPYVVGLGTLEPPAVPQSPEPMEALMFRLTDELLARPTFPIVVGGDHSITAGSIRRGQDHDRFGVIQLMSRRFTGELQRQPVELRRTMARVDLRPTLQIGIRSMDIEKLAGSSSSICRCTMVRRKGRFDRQRLGGLA